MDYITENMSNIVALIYAIFGTTSLGGLIIGIISFVKALKSEKRISKNLDTANQDIKITREGIVQAFKDAIVPKDIKVSINKQVIEIMTEEFDKARKLLEASEAKRTKMAYWVLRTFSYTAAYNKLTTSEQEEIKELLADIAEEEQIVDTGIL